MARPPFPSYEAFADRAKTLTKAIPAEFLEGVEEVVVHREARRHPLLDVVVTLGECEPSALLALAGGDGVRSIVHLYYGSFAELAREDPSFAVDAELEETIRHEVQHHLEDRAGVRTLIDEDDLFDAHERFRAGLENPAGWWRRGERLEPHVYAVAEDLFVELTLRRADVEARPGRKIALTILGEPFEAELPRTLRRGEILTFEGEGLLVEEEGHGHGHGHGHTTSPRATDEEVGATGDLHLVVALR